MSKTKTFTSMSKNDNRDALEKKAYEYAVKNNLTITKIESTCMSISPGDFVTNVTIYYVANQQMSISNDYGIYNLISDLKC